PRERLARLQQGNARDRGRPLRYGAAELRRSGAGYLGFERARPGDGSAERLRRSGAGYLGFERARRGGGQAMSKRSPRDIIIRPVVSEKSYGGVEEKA